MTHGRYRVRKPCAFFRCPVSEDVSRGESESWECRALLGQVPHLGNRCVRFPCPGACGSQRRRELGKISLIGPTSPSGGVTQAGETGTDVDSDRRSRSARTSPCSDERRPKRDSSVRKSGSTHDSKSASNCDTFSSPVPRISTSPPSSISSRNAPSKCSSTTRPLQRSVSSSFAVGTTQGSI